MLFCDHRWISLSSRSLQVLFGFSVILFWGDLKQSTGLDSGHWFWGTMLYMAVLLTVLGKAALISECVCPISLSCTPLTRMTG